MSDKQVLDDIAELLTASATWGEISLLEDYIKNGADPNIRNKKGDTTLHVACLYGEIECANTLLSYKADVNAIGADGKTPLHKAVIGASTQEPSPKHKDKESICANQINLVKLLVGRGADVTARDKDGNTPKDLAIQYDFYDCAEVLTELAMMQEEFERAKHKQQRIEEFYEACHNGDLDNMKLLFESLGDNYLNAPNKESRMTPLMTASYQGHVDIVDYLIEKGATPTRMQDRVGRTALHFASENGHVEVVKKLLEKLPKHLQRDDSQNGTSIHIAARSGHIEIVKLFLEAANKVKGYRTPCKQPNILSNVSSSLEYVDEIPSECFINVLSTSPQDNRTPLHEAVIGGHTDIVELLVNWMKENPPQNKGFFQSNVPSPISSPLPSHLQHPGTPVMPITPSSTRTPTTSSHSGIDLMTTRGRTPLQEAVKKGNIDIADILIKGGADINIVMRPALDVTANADLTALVESSLACDLDMVKFLLKHGATDARLKALSRVLRITKNQVAIKIAGLLLCHNSTVSVDTPVIELRRRAGKESKDFPLPIVINWASKKLPFIHSSWLPMTLVEADLPKANQYCITQLNLSDNKLKCLPIEVFQLEHIERLDISRNVIVSLPIIDNEEDKGWKCSSLTHIDVSHNQLESLPNILFELPEIKEITANHNLIVDIPIVFWSAPRLQKILLQHNLLTSFPSPIVHRDSGIGTLDDASKSFQASMSVGDVPPVLISQFSPPNARSDRITTPSRKRLSQNVHVSRGRLLTSPGSLFVSMVDRRSSVPTVNAPRSRLLEMFSTEVGGVGFEEESELEVFESTSSDEYDIFSLESLDLSHNKLTSLPKCLSCLAPNLKRLHIHHNKLKSIGCITDYSMDLELLDASFNDLSTAIACAPPRENIRFLPCAQKLLQPSMTVENTTPIRCSHRNHRVLKKLGYLKLSNNQLVDVQLFRTFVRDVSSGGGGELTSSMDDTNMERRSNTIGELANRKDFTKSSCPLSDVGIKRSLNSSDGSGGGSSKEQAGKEEVLYCLYPQLSTLDIGHNRLKVVPAHIELIAPLAVLTISHNIAIDTLPLELSNLEGLWSLEYDGVPLTNPPAEDLDKFRSASDKLLYMRSLLHDAKPNESMKLMLVGLQKQGKTTLLSRLREVTEVDVSSSTFTDRVMGNDNVAMSTSFRPAAALMKRFGPREAPLSTVGVDLGIWKYRKDLEPSYRAKKGSKQLRSVTFYTWDFGGQEEYYATHQCFLSFRSLYLVIFNMIDGEEGIDRLGPWLHNIQARAPDSPVVIIGTHLDTFKGEIEKERKKKELRDYIQTKFQFGRPVSQVREMGLPQIKEVFFIGCPAIGRGEGIADLRTALYEIAFSLTVPRRKGMGGTKSKLLEQQIPSSYLMLQEEVRKFAALSQQDEESPPVMKEIEFRDAARDIIPHSRELDQAVRFLHDNGILLHYATPALNHLYFIDPQWLCDMLAHVVTVPEVNRFVQRGSGPDAGILKTSVLSHLYKGKLFPQAQRKEYIELLGKFEVALLLDRSRLLVPSMLPKAPNYTVHRFETIFPRPPLANFLSAALGQLQEETVLSPYSPSTDPLVRQSIPQFPQSPSVYRTGLLLRRFYFMTYVPSGFWPRLISRFLTSSDIPVTILNAIGFTEEQIVKLIPKFISGESLSTVSLEWSYWTTGLELWYRGCSMLRISEIRLEGTFEGCDSSSISGMLPRTDPIEAAMDVDDLSFRLNGMWLAVDQAPNTGLEIIIPDYVCPSVLQEKYVPQTVNPIIVTNNKEMGDTCEEEQDGDKVIIPLQETSWMSAQLLALTVEQIDTLLEDWYPGIGSKDGGKNMYSIPYVNRVVPCPYCVNGSKTYTEERLSVISLDKQSDLLDPIETHYSVNEPESHNRIRLDSSPQNVRRTLLPSLNKSVLDNPSRKRLEDGSLPIATTSIDPNSSSPSLVMVQASKFGFMIESCIAACRGLEKESLICPSHPSHSMDLRSLVPDLMFGDLPTHFIIDERLLEQGKYVASGSFGEIYHGAVYPYLSARDDEGMEVAIKIDKQDHKHFNVENAAKAYNEIRAEVAILKDLQHENVIQFIGIVLNPLCFVLEWAPKGSLHGILTSYNNADARISPWTLTETARQVACGLEYLHYKHVVYYDLKSPNILVFEFPTPSESTQVSMGYEKLPTNKFPVLVKIADMGISRKLTPGGVVGYKGTPAFMAPEILSYAGKEACTEKVDIFSYGMFLYELVSLQFPFERQNLMHNQIEKLITDGERPPLQTRELNNPLLFLDVMRWAFQQDYHNRPSATQLKEVLSQSSVSHLVNAYPLKPFTFSKVSASCVVTLPVDISQSMEGNEADPETTTVQATLNTSYHVHGDLQEEVWLCSEHHSSETTVTDSSISVVTFRGKANFDVHNIEVGSTRVSCMACVNQSVWIGTTGGQVILYDATTHYRMFSRHLSVRADQCIVYIQHLTKLRQVIIARRDGCLLLFDEYLSEHIMPDCSHYDNFHNATQLPVKSMFKTQHIILASQSVSHTSLEQSTLWCGSVNNVVITVDVSDTQLSNCERLHALPFSESCIDDVICRMCMMKIGKENVYMWALSTPKGVLYLWDTAKKCLLSSYTCDNFNIGSITDIVSLESYLYISNTLGAIIILELDTASLVLSAPCNPVAAHSDHAHSLLLLSSRVFPRQWLPRLVGRSNAIEYYKDLLDEEDIEDINHRMIGHHSLLLVSIGQGFVGVSGNKTIKFSSQNELLENFLLLWLLPR